MGEKEEGAASSTLGSRAGYNQSGSIVEILANLRLTFVSSMMHNDYINAVKATKNIHNIISAKVNSDDSQVIDDKTKEIEAKLPEAIKTFIHNGCKYYSKPKLRAEVEDDINNLYRDLERLQDRYGYGMVTQDDPRMAVLQR